MARSADIRTEVVTLPDSSIQVNVVTSIKGKLKKVRQRALLNKLISQGRSNDALNYLGSFNGKYFYAHGERESFENSRYRVKELRKGTYSRNGIDVLAGREVQSVLKQLLKKFDPTEVKKPTDKNLGQWIGIEIECIMPIAPLLQGQGPIIDRWQRQQAARRALCEEMQLLRIANVQVKDDGSIRCKTETELPIEFTVLTQYGDMSNLKALLAYINAKGVRVNSSCGLHVHLDQRDLLTPGTQGRRATYKALQVSMRAKRIGNALGLLSQMVPAVRRNNTYCKLAVSRYDGDRYFAVNKTSLKKYGTIEIRLHSPSTSFSKINNWVELLYLISRSPKLSRKTISTVADLIDTVKGITPTLIEYAGKRVQRFAVVPDASAGDSEDTSCQEAG